MKTIHNLSTEEVRGQGRSRITSQSQAVLGVVTAGDGHLTADEVYERVRLSLPRISLATVYRNLHELAEVEAIGRVLVDGKWQFEADTSDHYHVLCVACQKLENVEAGGMASDVEEFFGRWTDYRLTGHELLLFGVCPTCRENRGRR